MEETRWRPFRRSRKPHRPLKPGARNRYKKWKSVTGAAGCFEKTFLDRVILSSDKITIVWHLLQLQWQVELYTAPRGMVRVRSVIGVDELVALVEKSDALSSSFFPRRCEMGCRTRHRQTQTTKLMAWGSNSSEWQRQWPTGFHTRCLAAEGYRRIGMGSSFTTHAECLTKNQV